jgi:hypothetical protein
VDFEILFKTLKDIKGDSSPGMDGILGALYKLAIQRFPFDTEPSLFATTLLALINAVLKTAHIPTVEKVAIIHLILKAKEDPKEPAAYRPISLINVLLKIIAKLILVNRIQQALEDNGQIAHEQAGCRGQHEYIQNLAALAEVIEQRRHDKQHTFLALLY